MTDSSITMTSKIQLEVVGHLKDPNFQIAKITAEELKQKFPSSFEDAIVCPLLEFDWHSYLSKKKQELKGEVWEFKGSAMCFENGRLLGNEQDLTSWAEKLWGFTFSGPQEQCVALAEDYYSKHLQSTGHTFVYMDIEIDGIAAGRLLFELFSDLCPKTCKNFQALCTGEEGLSPNNVLLSYRGSLFHRIVPNGWIQGGDISPGSRGNGGESIYGPAFKGDCKAAFTCEDCQNVTDCLWLECSTNGTVKNSSCVNASESHQNSSGCTLLINSTCSGGSHEPTSHPTVSTPVTSASENGTVPKTMRPTAAPTQNVTAPATNSTVTTVAPSTAPQKKSTFDAASFIGGIVLVLGLQAVVFFLYKFCKSKDRNYHTL